jgi:hypothetical protein
VIHDLKNEYRLSTPVALMIYKRPDTTARVLAEIAKAKPPKLLVIADGPRPNIPGEAEEIAATRAVIEQVDWECEVLKNYADTNLGCGTRVSSGLSWVFNNVDEAIILEDDCLPHPTFFRFCEELLEKYRYDQRIMAISGDNFQPARRNSYSYYFSSLAQVWGWASWSRAWQYYDFDISLWPKIREGNLLQNILSSSKTVNYWNYIFQNIFDKNFDTWDHQWVFTCFINNGLTIMPNDNLVSNIGFGPSATHTKSRNKYSFFAFYPTKPMEFPLSHPPYIIRDKIADDFTQNNMFTLSFLQRIKLKLYKFSFVNRIKLKLLALLRR